MNCRYELRIFVDIIPPPGDRPMVALGPDCEGRKAMRKKSQAKVALHRETLRHLDPKILPEAGAAGLFYTDFCATPIGKTNPCK
jgi:hypothetical protein